MFLLSHSWDKCVSAELRVGNEKKMWLTYSIAFNRSIQNVSQRYTGRQIEIAVLLSRYLILIFIFIFKFSVRFIEINTIEIVYLSSSSKRFCAWALARSIAGTVIPISTAYGWARMPWPYTTHIILFYLLWLASSSHFVALQCDCILQAEFFRHVHILYLRF